MKLTFEKFEIRGLHGYKNISLDFSNKMNIFVGENGLGKTTILNMLYYLLNGNYEELGKYNFNAIVLKMGEGDEIEFLKDDLLDYIDSPLTDEIVRKYLSDKRKVFDIERVVKVRKNIEKRGKGIQEWIDDIDVSIQNRVKNAEKFESLDLNELFNLNRERNFNIPKKFFIYTLAYFYDETHIHHNENMNVNNPFADLSRKLNEIRRENKILYFPTYRRIEESLFDKEDLDNLPFREEIKANLINFGMDDVTSQIKEILYGIKTVTSRNYEQMTTGLLNQYTEETEFSFSHLETIEPETLKIALKRLGNKVSEETINKIIKKIEKKEFSIEKDKYLMNLLNKIIENYLELSKTDKKINSFVEVVNKYLVNKQYIYDQSSLDLDIYDKNRRKIELSQLSSGEKQIVSIFSKIILEDKEKIIALFDEPELSLSIEWQKDFLVDLSKSENLNFLMAVTHSPFIFENLFENAFEIEVKMEDNVPYVDEEFSND